MVLQKQLIKTYMLDLYLFLSYWHFCLVMFGLWAQLLLGLTFSPLAFEALQSRKTNRTSILYIQTSNANEC